MNQPKRILVIRLSAIGDIVLTTPILRWLKMKYPKSEIEYLTKPEHQPLLRHNPHISRIHQLGSFNSNLELPFDLVIDLQNNHLSRSHTPRVVREVYRYQKENWKKFLLVWVKWNFYREILPVPERYKKSVEVLQLPDDGRGCEIVLTSDEIKTAQEMISSTTNQKILAVCYGAKHFTKRYPPEKYAAFLSQFNPIDWKVILLGSETDSINGKLIREGVISNGFPAESLIDFSGKLSLRETAALLSLSHHVLTGDTGLMHIATAFQKDCTVIFGSSVKEFGFLPYRSPFNLIENPSLTCRPCSHIGRASCPKGHFKCMNDLELDFKLIN
ncbi:MAG: glycosyltransferase family 9 protein [Chloroherpetonaceae bacterium]|nr:glycosyltransferase family 9 protein [Chloroherpetonaceae bacterium]